MDSIQALVLPVKGVLESDVAVTNGNNLKVSVEEYDPTFLSNPFPVANFYLNVAKGLESPSIISPTASL